MVGSGIWIDLKETLLELLLLKKLLLTSQRELLASRVLRDLQCSDCSWRSTRKIQKASLFLQGLQVG